MFEMFQRRDQQSQTQRGDYLASFITMSRGSRGLSAREKLSVARRVETAPPLDNPLSALEVGQAVSEGAHAPATAAPAMPAVLLPVSAPAPQSQTDRAAPISGGLTW